MKRSEAIRRLLPLVISPYELITSDKFVNGEYRRRAERLLNIIENEIGMSPPFIENPRFQGGHRIATEPYYVNEWEPEDE